ncbi:MAG: M48 family metalloprotease [Alphaproteobacteria bacterium]|nr:M48 family metalloprotease [Alphaproteobacteria bacterium]MCB9974821.1 M48 family metalloprotease [Rhodospirillales bacterium]
MIKHIFKHCPVFAFKKTVLSGCLIFLAGCSTNPATGEQQFTALMSPHQEQKVGAQEHQKILEEYGLYQDQGLQTFLQDVGQRVSRDTERPDVRYSFYLLDSSMVNAFALPGGYIYMTRGLLALANSEAEVASVLAHETGHITARHSAERYSRGVITMLGAAILSTAVGDDTVNDALGLGSDLYMKSYSRGQENEADMLGIRYLSRAGYDPRAMTSFLQSLQADTALESRIAGERADGLAAYMSTHPATQERVTRTAAEVAKFPPAGKLERESYLQRIAGMTYGESAGQGFVRGRTFYHTDLGFQFTVPEGFRLINRPLQVIGISDAGALIVFDFLPNPDGLHTKTYVQSVLLKDRPVPVEPIEINGMSGTTTSFKGSAKGRSLIIRLIVLPWGRDRMARFQIAYPPDYSAAGVRALQSSTYSFKTMNAADRKRIKPFRISIVRAGPGDTVANMAGRMPFDEFQQERFRVLNAMRADEQVIPGRLYKIVAE